MIKKYCLLELIYSILLVNINYICIGAHMKRYITCVYVMMIVLSCISMSIYADMKQFNFCTDSAEAAMRLAYRWLHEVDIEKDQVELVRTLEMRFCYMSCVRVNGTE